MSKKQRNSLLRDAEILARALIFEITGGAAGKLPSGKQLAELPIGDKRAVLDSVTKFIAVQNKVDPKDEESGFSTLMREMKDDRSTTSGIVGSAGDSDKTETGEEPNSSESPNGTAGTWSGYTGQA